MTDTTTEQLAVTVPTVASVSEMLGEMAIDLSLSGSRQICPQVVGETSDYDFIVLVRDLAVAAPELIRLGFTVTGSMVDDVTPVILPDAKFASLKKGNINVIATSKREFFDKFLLATRTATLLGLVHKCDRIALFQAILYGNG